MLQEGLGMLRERDMKGGQGGGGWGSGGWGRGSPDELVPGFWELKGDGQTVQLGFGFCQVPLVSEPT